MKKRRIHAADTQPSKHASLSVLLLRRELGCTANSSMQTNSSKRQLLESALQLIGLQDSFDTHDPAAAPSFGPSYMQQPSAVAEMALHQGLLFVLLQSGLCPVFDTAPAGAQHTQQQHEQETNTQQQHTRLGYLNQQPGEVIRSLVVNTHDSSVVTVSCLTSDSAVLLHCTSTPAQQRSFSKGSRFCAAGQPILEVVGGWGFVEFDDACSKVLLLNTHSKQYKVYDMAADYRLLFTLPAAGVADIKLSPQYLLLLQCGAHQRQQQPFTAPSLPLSQTNTDDSPASSASPHSKSAEAAVAAAAGNLWTGQQSAAAGRVVVVGQPAQNSTPELEQHQQEDDLGRHVHASGMSLLLVVYAAANGQVVAQHRLVCPGVKGGGASSPFDVLELCGDRLLMKLPLRRFEVFDVLSMRLCGASDHEHLSQVSSFLHLVPQGLFLTVCGHTPTTWDFKARLVAAFEDNSLWYPGIQHSNTVYITDAWMVSLCRAKSTGAATCLPSAAEPGAVHISDLKTGRLLASVAAPQPAPGRQDLDYGVQDGDSPSKQRTARALTDVTSLLFVEEGCVIYTGSQQGVVHVWAPGCRASSDCSAG